MRDIGILLFLLMIVGMLLFGALRWEADDMKKLWKKPNVYEIKNPRKREREYKFYSTFNYENNIMWRSLFISGTVAALIIYIFLKSYGTPEKLELNCFVILFIIFLVYYLTHIYRTFHVYRVMASKIKRDLNILEVYNV